jgi:hypothetical protein
MSSFEIMHVKKTHDMYLHVVPLADNIIVIEILSSTVHVQAQQVADVPPQ